MPFLLTPAFLRVLVNSLSRPDTHLHAAARRLTEQLSRHAESSADATLRVAVAVALQRQRGGGFDRLTKTKYAANLLQVSLTPPPCTLPPQVKLVLVISLLYQCLHNKLMSQLAEALQMKKAITFICFQGTCYSHINQ